jgi:hypothetical protein
LYPMPRTDFHPSGRTQLTREARDPRATLAAHGPGGTEALPIVRLSQTAARAAVALIASNVARRPSGGPPLTPQGAARAAIETVGAASETVRWEWVG